MNTFLIGWTLISICALVFRTTRIWEMPDLLHRRGLLMLTLPGLMVGWGGGIAVSAVCGVWMSARDSFLNFQGSWLGKDLVAPIPPREIP